MGIFRCFLGAWLVVGWPALGQESVLLRGGKVVDGTGAPWYRADVLIEGGRIAKIGRVEAKAVEGRVIDVTGRVVAPGFIDMMGQSATPLLDNPQAAANLLAQGITTINAGEGASAAPLSEAAGRFRGWTTMAEYFQLLELRGLPINVVQTVGHTQVRRHVMGVEDRAPTEAELEAMKALVREAMEAGALGVSTALIYPPAVYADTREISALAEVAGTWGGRYYTHMRNEGDQLLEAIDEALEIGRTAGTPVHIFHLKAAGRANWGKMEVAIGKIHAARAAGEEVTADIYPYVNNGLSIPAMVHPRHFKEGWAVFRERVDDPALQQRIREEMESDEGDWENWFKHLGRDWDKLIVGRANHLRYDAYQGRSLAAIAHAVEADPWEVFFDLVKTDAFVLPESMSEANKRRLMREPFVSYCTDVGPYGGSGNASHPRGFGALARIFSKYVREEKVISLERAVAQASAVAANAVMVRDRGRLAEGLAADLVVFDAQGFNDRASFSEPYRPAEGMELVLVNGEIAYEGGKPTAALPGRVLRGPGYRKDLAPSAQKAGEALGELASLDRVVEEVMEEHRIPGAALAVTDQGRLVYARGFGYADIAEREGATPQSLFRIASISKPVTATAVMRLVEEGKLSLEARVFDLLDDYPAWDPDRPVDPRLAEITVRHLLQHEGGWDRGQSFDAMFRSVAFAEALGVPAPASQDEVILNMRHQPLDFDPGQRQAYSNFGFCLLGRLVEAVTDMSYEAYVKSRVLDPAGARTMRLGRSFLRDRAPGEVRYYSPYRGASVFADTLGQKVPYPYGGWNLEAMDSHGAWIASAIDLARFASAFDRPDSSPLLSSRSLETMHFPSMREGSERRHYVLGWARSPSPEGPVFTHSGSLAGTSTLLVRRPDGRNWVVLFNGRSSPKASRFSGVLRPVLEEALNAIKAWPEGDLFSHYPNHLPNSRK